MSRRLGLVVLAAVLATMVAGSACFAQLTVPNAYVKGSGAIKIGDSKNIGQFEINVVKQGPVVSGGLKFTEIAPNSTKPVAVIVSRVVKTLCVQGNFATVTAEGLWNNTPVEIKVECLDDNPSGDWFHIRAKPIRSLLPVIYDAAGGVIKGDIVVFSQPAVYGYAKGCGAIRTSNAGIGRFWFTAELTAAGVRGWINYVDLNPLATSITARPTAVIYVPRIDWAAIEGNSIKMRGKGTLNGQPALVEVKAVDNGPFAAGVAPDEFYIRATSPTADAVTAVYEAGGPLIGGDIVVVSIKTTE
ncbi:MAG: hypothetical protein QHI38_01970 [Armatimonadota bacterium]|nr:hypothetical protein [Armatimonadota bacterium]